MTSKGEVSEEATVVSLVNFDAVREVNNHYFARELLVVTPVGSHESVNHRHDRGVGQCGDVPERAVLGHIAQQSAHDFARTRLGQVRRQNNLTRLGDGADGVGHVLS